MTGKGGNQIRGVNGTVRDYLVNIKPQHLSCIWDKGKWTQAHGDNKASFRGAYILKSMKTSTQPPEYRILLLHEGEPVLNFTMPGSPNKNGSTDPPTPREVIDIIAIELGKIGK
ncbi:uncharacterized protein N7487_004776 [Penicillium crustosum]|uniref:uncharacterized protein n=1 Tax=Penicillium crustosum TaxID=36656 RepID=UPI00238A671F|nr:uncharacterized protein N7487_004776 [Penicillium crustosum]KAJ5410417.1 hypothetical protein N7487_004776 [Penicillium crustosum]